MAVSRTLGAALLALGLVTPTIVSAEPATFLHVSDIHFDPFDPALRAKMLTTTAVKNWWPVFTGDPEMTLSQWGSDTNHALFASALSEIAGKAADADFVLVTGDLLSHSFPDNTESVLGFAQGSAESDAFAVRTTLFVAESLRAAIPGKPIILSLGNNDSSCGDYEITPGGSYLAATREAVRDLVGPALVADDFDATYLAGGYYAARHPTLPDTTVIVLDDVMWSARYQNSCGTTGLDGANAMMTWLEAQLASAKAAGRKVWLTHHIPVGFDAYSTAHSKETTCAAKNVPMLAEPFAAKYVALLQEYGGGTVTANFTGHTHYDDYRLLRNASGTVTGVEKIAPAISPIFGQNPGFLVFTYDRESGALDDFSAHYLTNLATAASPAEAVWKEEYIFSEAYGVAGFSPVAAEAMWQKLSAEGTADDTFRTFYNVSHGELAADTLDAYICTIGHADAAGFTACMCGG